jgi:uncharacterized protein (DUF1778 family)
MFMVREKEGSMQASSMKKAVSDDRIVSRIPRVNRVVIEKAAAVYGATINQFIVQSALDRASEILEREELLRLSERDAQLFLQALDKPPLPNQKLINALDQHTRLVTC